MKEIKAIIQPFLLPRVVHALQSIPGLPGLTVSEVHGFGRTKAAGSPGAFENEGVEYVKKSKLEVVVPDEMAPEIIQVIETKARTGNPGDGKIFVSDVGEIVRISTGERGASAV